MDREKLQDISSDIKRVANSRSGRALLSGKVVDGTLDEENLTVDVVLTADDAVETGDADDVPTAEVLLGAVSIKNDGVVLYPADGSDVVVGEVDGPGMYVVVRCSELVKLEVIVGESKVKVVDGELQAVVGATELTITDGLVKLNGDGNGGIPKVQKTADKIKALEEDVNALKQVFAVWTPVSNDGGAALKTAATAWASQLIMPLTSKADLENTKVKHG